MSKKISSFFNFWNELKRRKVVKASLVYLAVAYAILQAASIINPALGLPDWTITFVLILLVIVFILVIVLTWIYDITPEGIKVTQDLDQAKKEEPDKIAEKEPELAFKVKEAGLTADESDLQQRLDLLESRLREAGKVPFRSAFPVVVKKLAVPVVVIVLFVLFMVYKPRIIDVLGIGNTKREAARTHNANATMLIEKGDYEAAKKEVELSLASDPDYSYAWSNLAVISYRQGGLDQAVNLTIKAVTLDPKNSLAPYNLAYALDDMKDLRQAIRWYRKATEIDSTYMTDNVYTAASSALGRLYNSDGRTTDAIVVLGRAKKLFPGSKNICFIYKNLGNAYLLRQQTDSALKYLELSYRLKPDEPETSLYLARAYEASGEISKSIDQWKNYIDLETDTAKIREATEHRKELAVRQLQEIIK